MRPTRIAAVTTALAVVVAGSLGVATAAPTIDEPTAVVVLSKNQATSYLDLGAAGWSQGDRLALHSPLYQKVEGHLEEVGDLTVDIMVSAPTVPLQGRAQAAFTASLPEGQITAQGQFDILPAPYTATLAVTGGTGIYENARGHVSLSIQTEDRTLLTFALIP